jgi:signal peptidase I
LSTATRDATTEGPAAPPAPRRRPRLLFWVGAALVVALLAALLVSEPFTVRSSSMSPTLHTGDQILAEKLTPRFKSLHRNDLVVFDAPGTRVLMVKRVVALAGDRVGLADGRLVVNGRRVHESYVDLPSVDGVYFGPVVVPPGSVFVLGDDRADSVDSRDYGAVPVDRVVGRVILRLW